jgi:S1-C subfamily serine protease
MKALKLLLIFSLTFCFQKSIAQTNNLNLVYNKTKDAIFIIEILNKNDEVVKIGTGFFISSDGIGVSNFHVFTGAAKARIKTSNGKVYSINKVISWDSKKDLLKFQVRHQQNILFNYLLKENTTSQIGEKVVVIGNPKGLNNSISDGIISSFRDDEVSGKIIQTTVPISAGNSGSPLINLKGHFIGIISFSIRDAQNLNFAISASELNNLTLINDLIFPANPNQEAFEANSNPQQDTFYYHLAENEKDNYRAIELYTTSIKLCAQNSGELKHSYIGRAYKKVKVDDFYGAIADLKMGISIEVATSKIYWIADKEFLVPIANGNAYALLGDCYLNIHDKERACLAYSRAVELGEKIAQERIKEYCK